MSSPNLGIEYLVEGQNHAEVTVNDALNLLEVFARGAVTNRTTTAPPGSPADGDMYIVGGSPTGAWSGKTKYLAFYYGGWLFVAPKEGMKIWDSGADQLVIYDGSAWTVFTSGGAGGSNITVNSLSFSGTMTPTLASTDHTIVNVGAASGNFTMNAPTGASPFDGQTICFRMSTDGGAPYTPTWNAIYVFGTDIAEGDVPAATASTKWEMTFRYVTGLTKWRLLAMTRGF